MGPKIFSHIGKDGTAYTYLNPSLEAMFKGGLGHDAIEIKTGTPVSLTLAEDGKVKRINQEETGSTALPMQVTQFGLDASLLCAWSWKKKRLTVDHDATVVEEEPKCASLLWMYSIKMFVWGKLITNLQVL